LAKERGRNPDGYRTHRYRTYRTQAARRRRRRWIVLGVVALLVVAVLGVAGGSYWWFSAKVGAANRRITGEVQEALGTKPSTTLVSIKESEDAVNIILLGSDTRAETVAGSGRSDTIMVLHIDPTLDFASVLSIPRDLYVDIPGHPKNRINAAYAFGGPQLTIKTVKNVFGLNITKYAEIGFNAFEDIINSLGGVYVDVDRRYDDQTPRPIDLYPGYQLLNGADALLFARYRFDQNSDFGRMVRQQRVLAAMREQAMRWNLPLKLPGLVGAALESVATNLTANEILKLAYWVVNLDGSRIRQIVLKAPGQVIDGKAVLVADEATLKEAVTKLLSPPGTESGQDAAASTTQRTTTTTTTLGNAGASVSGTPDMVLLTGTSISSPAPTSTTVLEDLPDGAMWRSAQKSVPFALEAPRYIPPGFDYAYKMPVGDGVYQIDPGGDSKPAVRMLYRYKTSDLYLGVSATTWTEAPLASKGAEVERNGIKYTVVGTSGKVDHIWWKTDGVLYFVSNTLMYNVSEEELLKMAVSMTPVADGG
jgi:LCP family protein required for cell wall assembly